MKDIGQEMENSLSYLFPVLLGFHGNSLVDKLRAWVF